jgi:hypothetical protein
MDVPCMLDSPEFVIYSLMVYGHVITMCLFIGPVAANIWSDMIRLCFLIAYTLENGIQVLAEILL